MHIKDAGEDGLLTSGRLAGYIGEEKLESRLIANGQNVQCLTWYASLGVHVHQLGGCVSYASIPDSYKWNGL